VLFSGDAFNPSLLSTVTKGKQMVPILNSFNINTACVGNHDFDFGLDALEQLIGDCNFPWLMANVLNKETKEPLGGMQRARMITHQGRRLGLIGLVEREWLETLATIKPEEVEYVDFVEEGRRLARQLLEQGAEMVVALTHMRAPNDVKLAESVPEINLVLGGHDHGRLEQWVGPQRTLVLKSGTDFREMSLLTIHFHDDGSKPTVTVAAQEITSDIKEDDFVKGVVASYLQMMGEKMEQVIGHSAVPLDGRFSSIRTQETNLGNLVCDTLRSATGAECVILNAGTLRSDTLHNPGPIKMKDMVAILPMMDEICTMMIKGCDLIDALENGVSQFPKHEGRFPQVSGIKFFFDPNKEPGERVDRERVFVGGLPVEMDKEYSLATKEYLSQGKDGYNSFLRGKILASGEESPFLPTILRNYFQELQEKSESSKTKSSKNKKLSRMVSMLPTSSQMNGQHAICISQQGRINNIVDPQID